MQAQIDTTQLWDKVVNAVKQRVIHPTLWRTLETAVPIVIDGNQFVVGFPPGTFHLSGHMTSSEHRNAIETALKEFSGVALSLKIVDGTTLQDYQQVKTKEERMQVLKEEAYKKAAKETAISKSWDGLLESVGRKYAALPFRQFPQCRARYIEEMIRTISETMDVLMPADSPADEIAERSLARIIDKVGTLTETPPSMIALELQRFRGE